MFRKKKDPRVTALLESADETLLDGDDEARQEVRREIQRLNDLSGEHSRASDAASISSRTGKSKQVALRPKDSDTLNLAHKIDDLVEQSKPKQREQPNSTRPVPSSRNSPRASAQYSSQGQPAQPVSAQRSPQGQPAQPVSAQRSPQGRPAQPISAQNSPQGRLVQPASTQNSPQGRPAQPISAQNSPQGRSVQPASAQRSPQRVSVPRSPQGQSVRPVSGGIPLDWSPEQNVPRSQYYAPTNHPLRLTSSPQRPTTSPQQQQGEEESEEEEGEPMNVHQQEHLKRMLQEAGLWPPARLEEALASQTSAFVPETSSGNSISTFNQVQNQGDVVESAKDSLDADAEAAGDTENAATKRSPLATMKKWFQNAAQNKRKQE
ncbi:uncharacterized protein T069G_10859 [Trichoderma breve]|uniref:Uncharacterized protein n=1 Tax=Trichoderma breve TaxID=2034170 RepID=A0A9W9B8J9_9HYPO|nr:uncharacterized protein T069G_10859 [Trichoderma breve]KAJ4855301.1 hypothetical protein T069G_10859 [Trichoderma breve]